MRRVKHVFAIGVILVLGLVMIVLMCFLRRRMGKLL